jgi:hypothetical protein
MSPFFLEKTTRPIAKSLYLLLSKVPFPGLNSSDGQVPWTHGDWGKHRQLADMLNTNSSTIP